MSSPSVPEMQSQVKSITADMERIHVQKAELEKQVAVLSGELMEMEKKRAYLKMQIQQAERGGPAIEAPKAGGMGASAWNAKGWTWESRNALPQFKERLVELLVGQEVAVSGGAAVIKEMSKCDGDATLNVRKGKTLVSYELALEFKFRAEVRDGDGTAVVSDEGSFVVPEISNDIEDDDDFEIQLKLEGSSSGHDRVKRELRSKGIPFVRARISQACAELVALATKE